MSNGYPAHNFLRPDNFNGFGGEGILTPRTILEDRSGAVEA
jgi:hypothetical protein